MRLWLLLMVLVIANVGAQEADGLTLWHSHQSLQSTNFIDATVADYQAKGGPAVAVKVFSPAEFKAELLLAAGAGLLPDMMLVPSDYIGLHQQLDLLLLDSDWLPRGMLAEPLATAQIGRQQWGVPLIQGNQLVLYFNRQLVPAPAETWEALIAQRGDIEAKGKKLIGWNYGEMYWFVAFLGAFGGWPLDQQGQFSLNTPAMVAALDYYRSLSDSGMISARCTYFCAHQAFMNGEYAYAINGDWALADVRQALGESLGVATLPMIGSRPMKPMRASHVLVFPRHSEHGEIDPARLAQIKAFVRFLMSDAEQQKIFTVSGQLPVTRQAFTQAVATADEQTQVMLAQLNLSAPMPSEPQMTIAWQAMAKGFARLMRGSSAADAALVMQELAEREWAKAPGK